MADLLVAGTTSPQDVSGVYQAAGTHNGESYYQRGSDPLFIWYWGVIGSTHWWYLTSVLGETLPPDEESRRKSGTLNTPEGGYSPWAYGSPLSGIATAAWHLAVLSTLHPGFSAPIYLLPECPPAMESFLGESTDWPPPETITVDKWCTPLGALPPTLPPLQPLLRMQAGVVLPPVVDIDIRTRGTCELLGLLPWPTPDQSAMGPIDRQSIGLSRYYLDARGLYRIFNAAEYRFYRSSTSTPPAEGDTPFATSSSLPATPTTTFGDGTWLISCSYFNGVLDSGFLPLGPNGETYLRLDISGGSETGSPPKPPADWRLEARPAGVVRVTGVYFEAGADAADQWAIAYTIDGSTPASGSPDLTAAIETAGVSILQYDLPAAGHGATVSVRLQTRRNDGTVESPSWVYSEGSIVKTLVVDAVGPSAPLSADDWPGQLPEDL